jgi:hypothetical protein
MRVKGVPMPEPKKSSEKKISLAPLTFDEALKGLLETEPAKEKEEKKATTKPRKRTTSKKTESDN